MNKKRKKKPPGAAAAAVTLNMCWVWQLWILDLQMYQYMCVRLEFLSLESLFGVFTK